MFCPSSSSHLNQTSQTTSLPPSSDQHLVSQTNNDNHSSYTLDHVRLAFDTETSVLYDHFEPYKLSISVDSMPDFSLCTIPESQKKHPLSSPNTSPTNHSSISSISSGSATSSFSNTPPNLSSYDMSMDEYPTIPIVAGSVTPRHPFPATPDVVAEKENMDVNLMMQPILLNCSSILESMNNEVISTHTPTMQITTALGERLLSDLRYNAVGLKNNATVQLPCNSTTMVNSDSSKKVLPQRSQGKTSMSFLLHDPNLFISHDAKISILVRDTLLRTCINGPQSHNIPTSEDESEFSRTLNELGIRRDSVEGMKTLHTPLFSSVVWAVSKKLERRYCNRTLPSPNQPAVSTFTDANSTNYSSRYGKSELLDAKYEDVNSPCSHMFSSSTKLDSNYKLKHIYHDQWHSPTIKMLTHKQLEQVGSFPTKTTIHKANHTLNRHHHDSMEEFDLQCLYDMIILTQELGLNQTYLKFFSILKIPVVDKQDMNQIESKIDAKLRSLLNCFPHLLFYGDVKQFSLNRLLQIPQVLIVKNDYNLLEKFSEIKTNDLSSKKNKGIR